MGSAQKDDPTFNPAALSRRSFLAIAGPAAAGLVAAGATLAHVGPAYPAENRKKIRMGVVGGGFGAGFQWHEHPNCVVTGVTDLYPARRAALKNRYKCDRVYDSLEIMLKEAKDIDAVAVFSGAPDHAKHVQLVHGARLARGLGRAGLHHARRGGHAQGGQGKDGPEVHDGRVELLQPGVHLRPQHVPRRRLRRAVLLGERVLPPTVQPGDRAHRQRPTLLRPRRQAVLALGPAADALSDPFARLPGGRDQGADHQGLVPRLARQRGPTSAKTRSSPTTSTRTRSGPRRR